MNKDTDFLIVGASIDRLNVASGVLVFSTQKDALQILLIRCPEPPYEDKWCIPCAVLRITETADEAAQRCLNTEVGLKGACIEQLYTFSDIERNPHVRTIMISYIAMIPEIKLPYVKDRADHDIVLFTINRTEDGYFLTSNIGDEKIRVEKKDMLFDHADLIQAALDRMAGKIDYTEIGFRFLNDPQRFTLTELRHIYDAVKGTHSDIGNFRRFIKNRYITNGKVVNNTDDRKEMEHAGRPAATFRYTGNFGTKAKDN